MIDINFGDLAQRARRAFKLVGRLPMKLDETVLPVAIVANLDRAPFSTEPRTWMFAAGLTGTVAVVGYGQISNPVGSNALITIDQLNWVVDVGNVIELRIARNGQGMPVGISQPALTNAPQQSTLNTTGATLTQFNTTPQAAASGTRIAIFKTIANTQYTWKPASPIVLFPGDFFNIATALAAYTATVSVEGSEYVQTAP